jgi:signal transduction histidine kinase
LESGLEKSTERSTSRSLEKIKVLLVDDLAGKLFAHQALLKHAFPNDQDLEIFQAMSGVQALSLLLDHDFAVAMIDVQMPGMDGFELAELMRGTDRTKNVPIIFVTAGARDARYTFKGYESGAVDFLYKPLEAQVVQSKIRVFLELDRQRRLLQMQLLETQAKEQELKKALAIRDEFLGIASHELRTPLTSLKLHLQMMDRNFRRDGVQSMTPDRVEKMLKTSNRQIETLTNLIEDLMDVSRITNGKLTLDPVTMDLVEMVKDVTEYFSEHLLAAESKVEIRAEAPVVGLWDRERVQQVIVNLVSNAIKYGSGSPIEIEVAHDNRFATLKVIDHGMGIADEDQVRIFERFERAVRPTDSISGLGLGLFIVREIVAAQGGTISVQSAPSKGSTFTVQLPLKRTVARSQP